MIYSRRYDRLSFFNFDDTMNRVPFPNSHTYPESYEAILAIYDQTGRERKGKERIEIHTVLLNLRKHILCVLCFNYEGLT